METNKNEINEREMDEYFDFFNNRSQKAEIDPSVATLFIGTHKIEGDKYKSVNLLIGESQTLINALVSLAETDEKFGGLLMAAAGIYNRNKIIKFRAVFENGEEAIFDETGKLEIDAILNDGFEMIKNILKNAKNDNSRG